MVAYGNQHPPTGISPREFGAGKLMWHLEVVLAQGITSKDREFEKQVLINAFLRTYDLLQMHTVDNFRVFRALARSAFRVLSKELPKRWLKQHHLEQLPIGRQFLNYYANKLFLWYSRKAFE